MADQYLVDPKFEYNKELHRALFSDIRDLLYDDFDFLLRERFFVDFGEAYRGSSGLS